MKIYFPLYYNDFACIADRCKHSCCVGWEITIDDKTAEKYAALPEAYDIKTHIRDGKIEMCDGQRCPFLCDNGLCRIISNYGEEYISEICKQHPRFYHRIGGRLEGGIGASCEEACRIILSSDAYLVFTSHHDHEPDVDGSDFDVTAHRDYIYSVLSDRTLPFRGRIKRIEDKYLISTDIHTIAEWEEIFSDLELLNEDNRALISLKNSCDNDDAMEIRERFFAYLIFRHISTATSEENLRARVGFCLLLNGMLENFLAKKPRTFEEICDVVRTLSEEIEYSLDNTDMLIFEFESLI